MRRLCYTSKMSEPFSWLDLGRWLLGLRRVLPDRVLRWIWSDQKLLEKIEAFPVAQPPPHLFVRTDRENPELRHLAFRVFNRTPFALGIVAVSAKVVLDSRELFSDDHRFSSEISLPPYGMGVIPIGHSLTEPQANRLRGYAYTSARIFVEGGMILRTPFGERQKALSCDVDARIDR